MKELRWIVLLAAAATACDRAPGDSVVATAAGHELDVGDATALMELLPPDIPTGQPEVVMAVADLWIDYTLLATATAEDSTLAGVDLGPLIGQQREVEVISALRDSVIRVDTALSEEQVRRRFALESPGARVRARHILLQAPQGATQAQRDSVRSLADDLLQRVRAGEDFEALAREYSADVTAQQGGDLGFFSRGDMLPAFDSAAFALQPGQLSEVVTTIYGHHIIRVDEKETPAFDSLGTEFRRNMQVEMLVRAESLYVRGVERDAGLEIAEGAADAVREIAQNPVARLSRRASRRALVTFEGGELTVEELRTFMQTRDPAYRQQVRQASVQQIQDNILRALVRRELLVNRATALGIAPTQSRTDSLAQSFRDEFRGAARQLGLVGIEPVRDDETPEEALERTVHDLVGQVIRQEREVIPLGAAVFTLRQQYPAEIIEAGVQSVVQQLVQTGAGAQLDPLGAPPDDTATSAEPDE